jgi:hypothetical protein
MYQSLLILNVKKWFYHHDTIRFILIRRFKWYKFYQNMITS